MPIGTSDNQMLQVFGEESKIKEILGMEYCSDTVDALRIVSFIRDHRSGQILSRFAWFVDRQTGLPGATLEQVRRFGTARSVKLRPRDSGVVDGKSLTRKVNTVNLEMGMFASNSLQSAPE